CHADGGERGHQRLGLKGWIGHVPPAEPITPAMSGPVEGDHAGFAEQMGPKRCQQVRMQARCAVDQDNHRRTGKGLAAVDQMKATTRKVNETARWRMALLGMGADQAGGRPAGGCDCCEQCQ
ncbi:MAG: hypothetical protein HC793_05215, partial [Aquincola sp.]|nr:hypothetical protein [Aquincola sp.]